MKTIEQFGLIPDGFALYIAFTLVASLVTHASPLKCANGAALLAGLVYVSRLRWELRDLRRDRMLRAARSGGNAPWAMCRVALHIAFSELGDPPWDESPPGKGA